MLNLFFKSFIIFLCILPAVGCTKKETSDNFDFSNIKLKKKNPPDLVKDSKSDELKTKIITKKLLTLAERNEVLSRVKFGKKDPFSEEAEDSNQLLSNFILKGFISFNNKDLAHVKFKENSGFIGINSVGDLNTKLLPKNAFVKEINPSKKEIKISIDDDIYTVNLSLKKLN